MSENTPKLPNWKNTLAYMLLRAMDSGNLPILIFLGAGLGFLLIITRKLTSHDTLEFCNNLLGGSIFGPTGWLIAIAQIPLTMWIIRKSKNQQMVVNDKLLQENEKARVKLKQMELSLDNPSNNKQGGNDYND